MKTLMIIIGGILAQMLVIAGEVRFLVYISFLVDSKLTSAFFAIGIIGIAIHVVILLAYYTYMHAECTMDSFKSQKDFVTCMFIPLYYCRGELIEEFGSINILSKLKNIWSVYVVL